MATAIRSVDDLSQVHLVLTDTEAGRLWQLLDQIANEEPLKFSTFQKDFAAYVARAIPRECYSPDGQREQKPAAPAQQATTFEVWLARVTLQLRMLRPSEQFEANIKHPGYSDVLRQRFDAGWGTYDAAMFMSFSEDFAPELSEEDALTRMREISKKYNA